VGADDNWRPVTDQTRVIYSALPPGKYTFMVMASNSQGIWNIKPVTFHFIIKTTFLANLVVYTDINSINCDYRYKHYINIREENLIKEKIILEERLRKDCRSRSEKYGD